MAKFTKKEQPQEVQVVATPEPVPDYRPLHQFEIEAKERDERKARLAELDAQEEAERQARIKRSQDTKSPLSGAQWYSKEEIKPSIALPQPTAEQLGEAVREPLSKPRYDPFAVTDPVYKQFNYCESEAPKPSITLTPTPARSRNDSYMDVVPQDVICDKCGHTRRSDQNYHVLPNGTVCFITK